MILATTWKILVFLHQNTKVGMHSRVIQYCAKVMQTIIDEYRAFFSRFIADISAKHRMD